MEHCHICREPLEKVQQRLDAIIKRLEQTQRSSPDQVFFDNQEFLLVMNISKRTAQQWRDGLIIGFSQVGNKIYYRLSDILELLEKHFKPANNISL